MKRSRFTEERIIEILREHEAGAPVAELRRSGMHRGVQLTSQDRPRGFGRTDDRADREQRKMPIPAFVSQVPAARVLHFGDSARTE